MVDSFFEAVGHGVAEGFTSVLTLAEVLVKPLRMGQDELADAYRHLLTDTRGLALCPIDELVCERAAQLRAQNVWLRVPDALQVATALLYRADLIVTNDERWRRLQEMEVVVLKDYLSE